MVASVGTVLVVVADMVLDLDQQVVVDTFVLGRLAVEAADMLLGFDLLVVVGTFGFDLLVVEAADMLLGLDQQGVVGTFGFDRLVVVDLLGMCLDMLGHRLLGAVGMTLPLLVGRFVVEIGRAHV